MEDSRIEHLQGDELFQKRREIAEELLTSEMKTGILIYTNPKGEIIYSYDGGAAEAIGLLEVGKSLIMSEIMDNG